MNIKELLETLKPYINYVKRDGMFIGILFNKYIVLTGEGLGYGLEVNIDGKIYYAYKSYVVPAGGIYLSYIIPTDEEILQAKTGELLDRIEGRY